MIATTDAEPLISLFEEPGFESRHTKEGIGTDNARNIRMKDANGFHLDITQGTEERHMNYERIQIRN